MYGALRRPRIDLLRGSCWRLLRRCPSPQVGIRRHTGVGYELVLNHVVPADGPNSWWKFRCLALAVECISPAPAVFLTSSPVVQYIAPAPAVLQARSRQWWSLVAPAPVLSESRAPGGFLSPAPAVFSVLEVFKALSQDRVPPLIIDMIFLSLLGGDAQMIASGRVYYWHVHTHQTRWTPPVSDDEDEDEEDEEVEDEDMDEIYGTESRFSRWVLGRAGGSPLGTAGRDGSVSLLTRRASCTPKLVVKGPDDFHWGDGFRKMSMSSAPCLVRLWIHTHASVGRFLRWYFCGPFCFWQSLVPLFLLEEYKGALFLGVDFQKCRIQRFLPLLSPPSPPPFPLLSLLPHTTPPPPQVALLFKVDQQVDQVVCTSGWSDAGWTRWQAAAQAVPAAGESDSSVPCCGMNG